MTCFQLSHSFSPLRNSPANKLNWRKKYKGKRKENVSFICLYCFLNGYFFFLISCCFCMSVSLIYTTWNNKNDDRKVILLHLLEIYIYIIQHRRHKLLNSTYENWFNDERKRQSFCLHFSSLGPTTYMKTHVCNI